ncbi:MAG: thiol-disulfide oxidoreductase [Parcubacteria group bacterium Gr01-1014_48]|nr:MAG: thiol-disulfide oxidoreductase [Parcubacteria group bacterium Greene0416_14]TSC72966.1 MAG: thiol-disulfide oxidoreductase [Parcubacteria group bacterium Gr01-1014_48]TSC99686.1 MAG: thiol-disulfide oxidoreductase [Parcubacteria group bacterium Greene1014_15]TSD06917.1 MAG: thiol-disulfide oxidoreductase [Parcubacteria group bacterium Greene0714_4]
MHHNVQRAHWHFFWSALLLVGLIGVTLVYTQKRTSQEEKVPGFGLEHFDGTITHLEEYRGRPVIINFWAAWCIACRSEMPMFEKIYQAYKDKGLVVLGVHRTETESQEIAIAFAREVGVTYLLIKDERTRLFGYFNKGLTAIPTTVFIDREGYVVVRTIGPRTEKEFFALAQDIL